MTESLLSMAKDLTRAQIQAGQVRPEEMTSVLNSTYETLKHLQSTDQSESRELASEQPTNWKKSITKYAVTCLECGATFKQLSTRHLRRHDLDGRSYRQKYGIPRTQSLASQDVRARRQAIVQRVKPWEKSPTNPKAAAKAPTKTSRVAKKKTAKKSPKKARTQRPRRATSA